MTRGPRKAPVYIIARINPCSCGCKGRDTWHRGTYRRTLRNVRPAEGRVQLLGRCGLIDIDAEAMARFPWGSSRVVREAKCGGWFIDRESALDAQSRLR